MYKNNRPYEHKKTGIALWCGSGFSLRTLKKENNVFWPSHFFNTNLKYSENYLRKKGIAVKVFLSS